MLLPGQGAAHLPQVAMIISSALRPVLNSRE